MLAEYRAKANVGIVAGLAITILPAMLMSAAGSKVSEGVALGVFVLRLGGYLLFIWGCGMYARAKGRSAAWGAFGLLSIFGLIAMVMLEDRRRDGELGM